VERELRWKPEIALDDGLRQTVDWYKNNTHWTAEVRGRDYLTHLHKYYTDRDSSVHAIRQCVDESSH
jgi:dTDP-D-glucose 4,6-dehydratase